MGLAWSVNRQTRWPSTSSRAVTAATVADDAQTAVDPNAYFVDQLFRPSPTATTAAPAADSTAVRAETGRILAQGAIAGSVSDPDKAYLAQIVASNTGLTQDEANARVTEVLAAVDKAKADAAAVAETARKAGIVGAFLGAIIGAALAAGLATGVF